MGGVESLEEHGSRRVAFQEFEHLFALGPDVFGVSHQGFLLGTAGILPTDFSVVHAGAEVSSALGHRIVVDRLSVSA